MSVPMQSPADPSSAAPSGITSFVTGQINFGWISDAWRLFSAQMGVWVTATLIFIAPTLLFVIAIYAMLWPIMFPSGFPPSAVSPAVPTPGVGVHAFPAPLTPGMPTSGRMGGIIALEIGFGLVSAFWAAYLYGGMFRMAVRQVRGLPLEMKDIFRGGPLFGRMLGAIFLLGFGGYFLEVLCLGPMYLLLWRHGPTGAMFAAGGIGVVAMLALFLVCLGLLLPSFALMADGDGVLTALKRSIRTMKGRLASAAGFVFVMGVVWYASALPCYVGLLATSPMIFLICALAYRDMVGMPNMVPPPAYYSPASGADVWPPAPAIAPQASLEERTQERN